MHPDRPDSWTSSSASHTPPPDPLAVFWLVYSPSGKEPPRIRYPDRVSAEAAARDMATKFRGSDFFVLKSVSCSAVDGVKTTSMKE
jgi:hypothetical protein